MTLNLQLIIENGEWSEELEKYKRLIGKLKYLTMTHLDIAQSISFYISVHVISNINHWTTLEQNFMLFEESSRTWSILQKSQAHQIECFPNADWALRFIEDLPKDILFVGEFGILDNYEKKMQYFNLVQNQNIAQWHDKHVRLYGYISY